MPENWPSWSANAEAAYGLPAGALADSSSAANQYLVARTQMQKYHDDFAGYGDNSPTGTVWGDIAAAWYTGKYRVVLAHRRKAAENAGEEYTASQWETDHCSNGNCLEWVTRQGTFTPTSGNCPEDEDGNLNCAPEPAVGSYVSSVLGHAGMDEPTATPAPEPSPSAEPRTPTAGGYTPTAIDPEVLAQWAAEPATEPSTPDDATPDQETLDALAFDDDDDSSSLQGACPEGFIEIKGQCVSMEKLLQALAESKNSPANLLTEDESGEEGYSSCEEDPMEVGCPGWMESWEEEQAAAEAAQEGDAGWGETITDPEEIARLEAAEAAGEHDPEWTPGVTEDPELHAEYSEHYGFTEEWEGLGRVAGPTNSPEVLESDIAIIFGEGGPEDWRERHPDREFPAINLCQRRSDGSLAIPQCEDDHMASIDGIQWPWTDDRFDPPRPFHPFALSSSESDRMMAELGYDMTAGGPYSTPRRRRGTHRPSQATLTKGGSGMPGIEGNCPAGYLMIMGRCVNIATLLSNLSE